MAELNTRVRILGDRRELYPTDLEISIKRDFPPIQDVRQNFIPLGATTEIVLACRIKPGPVLRRTRRVVWLLKLSKVLARWLKIPVPVEFVMEFSGSEFGGGSDVHTMDAGEGGSGGSDSVGCMCDSCECRGSTDEGKSGPGSSDMAERKNEFSAGVHGARPVA